MAEGKQPGDDRIFTYTIREDTGYISGQQKELEAALADGWRLIDFVCTPTEKSVCVTVLATRPGNGSMYVKFNK